MSEVRHHNGEEWHMGELVDCPSCCVVAEDESLVICEWKPNYLTGGVIEPVSTDVTLADGELVGDPSEWACSEDCGVCEGEE